MIDHPVRAAVLLSGGGRTLQNLLECLAAGDLDLDIPGVVSSRASAGGLAIAAEAGIPSAVFRRQDYPDVVGHNRALNAWLEPRSPQIIILAGYLCFYQRPVGFDGPVVNIHPALLPRYGGKGYYGDRVHKAVLEAGDTVTGCTVHLVDDQYDHGVILGQKSVPVVPGDDVQSLAARVFAAECKLYPHVLRKIIQELRSPG